MSQPDPLVVIADVLAKVIKKRPEITPATDLTEHLDSLDSMVFFMELEERTGAKFPDTNLVKDGFFQVEKLANHLKQVA